MPNQFTLISRAMGSSGCVRPLDNCLGGVDAGAGHFAGGTRVLTKWLVDALAQAWGGTARDRRSRSWFRGLTAAVMIARSCSAA